MFDLFCIILMSSLVDAADLKEYPKPFLQDGKWNGLIVVGSKAAVSDVVGAVDIAATISTEKQIIEKKDEVKVSSTQEFFDTTASKLLSVTSEHLKGALASGIFINEYGTFNYSQKIELPAATVQYAIDPDDAADIPAFYLFLNKTKIAYIYRLSFSPSLEVRHKTAASDEASNFLKGLKDKKLMILDKDYIVSNAEHAASNNIKLTLIGGIVKDTLLEGESKKYTLKGKDYETTLNFVSSTHAKFIINGESTAKLKDGDIHTLSDGTRISVSEILYQDFPGGIHSVTFELGSEKIELKDSDTTTHNYDGTVKIDSNTLNQVKLNIKTSLDEGATEDSIVKIDAIEINYTPSDDLYIPIGSKLSQIANRIEGEEGNAFLNGFDIEFRKTTTAGKKEDVKFKPSGKTSYEIEFTNLAKQKYSQKIISCASSTCNTINLGILSGSTFNDLVINESEPLEKNEYFILNKEKYSHIMRFKGVEPLSKVIQIGDEARGGRSYEISYSTNSTSSNNTGELVLDGFVYKINVNGTNITVDMNGDGDFADTANTLYTQYKGFITLLPSENNISFTTEKLDGSSNTDTVNAGVNWDSANNELDINNSYSTGYLYGFDAGKLQVGSAKVEEGYTRYGLYAKWNYTNDQSELHWIYPEKEIFVEIYVTGKDKFSEETSLSAVSLLGKNISNLDNEVTDRKANNLILIGGPCANALTAEIMANPKPCDKGFKEGDAIIKLYENAFGGKNTALVVAGYSAQDTRNAASVLKDYDKYVFSGKEVVVTNKLGKISINPSK